MFRHFVYRQLQYFALLHILSVDKKNFNKGETLESKFELMHHMKTSIFTFFLREWLSPIRIRKDPKINQHNQNLCQIQLRWIPVWNSRHPIGNEQEMTIESIYNFLSFNWITRNNPFFWLTSSLTFKTLNFKKLEFMFKVRYYSSNLNRKTSYSICA